MRPKGTARRALKSVGDTSGGEPRGPSAALCHHAHVSQDPSPSSPSRQSRKRRTIVSWPQRPRRLQLFPMAGAHSMTRTGKVRNTSRPRGKARWCYTLCAAVSRAWRRIYGGSARCRVSASRIVRTDAVGSSSQASSKMGGFFIAKRCSPATAAFGNTSLSNIRRAASAHLIA